MINFFKKLIFIFVLLIAWQLIYYIFNIKNNILPMPTEIIISFWNTLISGEIFKHILFSLFRVLSGFVAAFAAGVLLGILLSHYKAIGELIRPIIEVLRPIPPIAWIPIAILIFGLGNTSAFFIVFLGAFFPIFSNTYFGANSIPKIYKNISGSFELGTITYLRKILFFYSLPNIMTGLKIGMGMAWVCVIAAEMIGAQSGLGYFIQINRLVLRTDKIIVGMILIGIIGYILNIFINYLEKTIIKWKD